MSFASAFSGDTYTTCVSSGSPGSSPSSPSACFTSMSRLVRNAASVLPEPVGAAMSVCRPDAIAGQPSACASVGAPNRRSNHVRTMG